MASTQPFINWVSLMGSKMNKKAEGSENEDEETIVIEDEGQSTEETTSENTSVGDQRMTRVPKMTRANRTK
jgi:hypothetical protein